MRRWSSSLLSALALACASTQPATKPDAPPSAPAAEAAPKKKLFERLGGKAAVEAVIDDFLGRVAKDPSINSGFAVAHVPRVRQRLIELVTVGTGGPGTYSGRDMAKAHAGQGITNAQFDALVGHLVATLDTFKVPAAEKGELLAILGPMRGAIVEEP
ncbi:MAG: group 1 truncated hemoglobin [Myxococcaceae bacterium]|nr:group 1 truncated hemoglobin [Myxococcaceae bacterium]MCA3015099.1 group 1 truncated hemoglobin [Myxococcaceae bacterium]